MPVNRRPSGWLYNGDPDYKGTTVAERRQMQNTWDLLAEQERANQIEQEKLDFMKEQVYKSSKQEQVNKANQDIKDILIQGALRYQQEEDECQKIGIKYKNLLEFTNLLNKIPSVLQKLLKEKERLENDLKDKEYNKPQQELTFEKQLNAIKRLEDENSKLSKLFDRRKITKNKESIKYIKEQIELGKKEYAKQKDNIIKEYELKLQNLKESLNNINKQIEEEQNKPTIKTDFNKFRETHYNQDIELLFRRLDLNLDKVECQKEGTIEDYNKYFKTKILEN